MDEEAGGRPGRPQTEGAEGLRAEVLDGSFRQICSAVSTIHDIASGNYQPPSASNASPD